MLKGVAIAVAGLLLPTVSVAVEVDNPSGYFMRLCMKDTTVAAGKREMLCECLHNAFAYGAETGYALSDVITVDHRAWEAPDRRMPNDELGNTVRQLRKRCLASEARPSRSDEPRADDKTREMTDETE